MAVAAFIFGVIALIGGGDMYTTEIIMCIVGGNICNAIEQK